jgi:putative ATP-binding cassette transporter
LIQTPPWVLIDGTFGALDDDVLELVIDVFTHELKHTSVIHIGGAGEAHALFSKILHLVKAPRTPAEPSEQAGDGDKAASPKESGNPP